MCSKYISSEEKMIKRKEQREKKKNSRERERERDIEKG
jgi:hypothetical protein